jgi:3-oxoacid CoA-transferase subunit A
MGVGLLMNRAFCTGDTHGQFKRICRFCYEKRTSLDDYLIILGDAGLNYHLNSFDVPNKKYLAKLPITLLCIHGNHEERAWNLDSYKRVYNEDLQCYVYVEEAYPNILFIEDGVFYLKDKKCLAISGAYSIDKYYRLRMGYHWFPSEQPTEEEKEKILQIVDTENSFNYIFSHTVPLKYERELEDLFLPSIDQSMVDKSTEKFLDKVEDKIMYDHWYFGHYHASFDLTDKVTILFNEFIELNL